MKLQRPDPLAWLLALVLALLLGYSPEAPAAAARTLDLQGYADAQGAITVVREGELVDPYFALQALLLARDHGLQVEPWQGRWIDWWRRQPTGVLARYCRAPLQAGGWRPCQRADADDATLALAVRLLRGVPAAEREALQADRLQHEAEQALRALQDLATGLYHVAPDLPQHLLMDNLEVWSTWPQRALAQAIDRHFRLPAESSDPHAPHLKASQPQAPHPQASALHARHYRVSTQRSHREQPGRFYPEAAAQIYPLLMGFEPLPQAPAALYAQWMREHRSRWLAEADNDFPWGPIALLAWQQGDPDTVRCWQQRSAALRHGPRWSVTDEVVAQLLPPLKDPPPTPKDCQ